jgi:hypothetical protein
MSTRNRKWTIEELRVLCAIFFNASFSIGDDARDECRAIADCFGRTPSSIDRQWRNVAAVVGEKPGYNIGRLVKKAAMDYLARPRGSKEVALSLCKSQGWPLEGLIRDGSQDPLSRDTATAVPEATMGQLKQLCERLDFKVFSSGSQGFFKQKKLVDPTGLRYQAQISAVLIGSKADMTIEVRASREEVGYAVVPLLRAVDEKKFSTGRVGLYGHGKVSVGSERYQVSVQLVQIGDSVSSEKVED